MGAKSARDLAWVLGWLLVLWLIETGDAIWQFVTGHDSVIDPWGVVPRTLHGLFGIPLAPFLHQDFNHLACNSVVLLVLGLVSCRSYGRPMTVIAAGYAAIYGGFLAWTIGRPDTCHIGASGVAFGLLGFLLANGILRRGCVPFLIGLVVFLFYGGVLIGVLPSDRRISWEMHLGGFIGGVTASWVMRKRIA